MINYECIETVTIIELTVLNTLLWYMHNVQHCLKMKLRSQRCTLH